MDEDLSIDQLLAFKVLVQSKNPIAVAATEVYEKNKDKAAFYKSIKEALGVAKTPVAPASTPHATGNGSNGGGAAASAGSKPKNATPCFAFKETGICKNEKCRFSHELVKPSAASSDGGTAAAGSEAKNPAVPNASANSLGRSPPCTHTLTLTLTLTLPAPTSMA